MLKERASAVRLNDLASEDSSEGPSVGALAARSPRPRRVAADSSLRTGRTSVVARTHASPTPTAITPMPSRPSPIQLSRTSASTLPSS